MTHLVVTIPARTVNVLNVRENWRPRAARAKRQRTWAWAELRALRNSGVILGPVTVTLTRIAPRKMDGDGLQASLKAIRDGVADWLGVDDKDSDRLVWRYQQERGKVRQYAVRIEVAA